MTEKSAYNDVCLRFEERAATSDSAITEFASQGSLNELPRQPKPDHLIRLRKSTGCNPNATLTSPFWHQNEARHSLFSDKTALW